MWSLPRSSRPTGLIFLRTLATTLVFLVLVAVGNGANAQTESADTTPATASTTSTTEPRPDGADEDMASSTYRLQAYDLIDVDVYSEADLHKPARLGSDGTVLLPLIGSVKVGGLTVAEATELITKRYADGFVKNPSVLLTVLKYRKSTFSILGQVNKPGIVEIPEGAEVSILEAVSLAGGFAKAAAQNSLSVKRSVDGKDVIYHVKAGDMAQNANAAPFDVQPGDTIIVPTSDYQDSHFTVVGQVSKPGLFDIPEGAHMSIVDAISMAGGFTAGASQGSITVRRTAGGKITILKVKPSDLALDTTSPSFEVLPGDTISVPFRNRTFSILGQVEKPGIYEIVEGTHVNIIDAILMAGGYTKTAAQNSVSVKRVVDGKLTTLKVRARDMAEEQGVVPFEVQPGDIIKVNESWY
jgi:protein involved in polysaccharide export with SLBB domain